MLWVLYGRKSSDELVSFHLGKISLCKRMVVDDFMQKMNFEEESNMNIPRDLRKGKMSSCIYYVG